jgi:uncharacterized hydrophobic protein (TIGR00271 family)
VTPVLDELARLGDDATNVCRQATTTSGDEILVADVVPEAADTMLDALVRVGLPPSALSLCRLDSVTPVASGSGAEWISGVGDTRAWVEVVGQARASAQLLGRYLAIMAAAGVIASVGVLNDNQILIVGAMAVSPDLFPMSAACVGAVGRRPLLVLRAVGTLVIGLAVAGLAAGVAGHLLEAADLFSGVISDQTLGTLTTTDLSTIVIALAAGVAGMLAFETRAGNAVGVAISVTTIPAVAYFGVVAFDGDWADAVGALGVLTTNILSVLIAGTTTLAVQRWWRRRQAVPAAVPG